MEEILLNILVVGIPVGWFLRSAEQWRRDAKRARKIAPPPPAPAPPAAPPVSIEPRIERLLERLSQRMETLEDRIDFAERLLDARGTPVRPKGFEATTSGVLPETSTRR